MGGRATATLPDALRAANGVGMGRELFAGMRRNASTAEEGACSGCNTRAL
jgi:phosphogluconate dehydratase